MAIIVVLEKMTTAALASFVGDYPGQMVWNTDTNLLVTMDGVTPGGIIVFTTAYGARAIRESTGPTQLDILGIADGKILKRVGSTIVGADNGTTGAQGPAGPAIYMEAEQGEDGAAGPPGIPGPAGANGSESVDGGLPDSVFGGTTPIDGGSP